MRTTRCSSMLLGCALFAVWSLSQPQSSQAAPRPRIKVADRVKSGPIVIAPDRLPDLTRYVGAPIPLMTDALNYARTGNVAKGTKAAVYATVVIASAQSQIKPGRSSVTYANSVLSLVGPKDREHFAGDLKVAYNHGDEAAPFRASTLRGSSWRIMIYPNGLVSIRSTRPRSGRIPAGTRFWSFKSDGADGFLWGRDTSGADPQLVSVALAKSVSPLSNASSPAPASTAPRGMEIEVSGEFTVMNADDGGVFKPDRILELYGVLNFGTQYTTEKRMWFRESTNPRSSKKGDVIKIGTMIMKVSYDNPQSWRLRVFGGLSDYDKASDSDIVWSGDKYFFDMKAAVENNQAGFAVMPGSADDEYADFKLTFRKIADIY